MKLFEFRKRKGFASVTGQYGLESYAFAYWRAARGLVEGKLFDGRGRPDFSTFPIAFLYRHALELTLKSILIEHDGQYSKNPSLLLKNKAKGHELPAEYLREIRALVSATPDIDVPQESWSSLDAILAEWRDIDPDGMAFRYSIDKKAKKDYTNPDSTFEVVTLAQGMDDALEALFEVKKQLDAAAYKVAL
jgi:hypothetical protein